MLSSKTSSIAYLEHSHLKHNQAFDIHHVNYLHHEDYQCKLHFHDVHELIFFEQVAGEFFHPDGTSTIMPGDIVFTPAMESHEFSLTEHRKSWYVLQFTSDQLSMVSNSLNLPLTKASHLRLDANECSQLYQCLQWLLNAYLSAPENIATNALCHYVLAFTFSYALSQQASAPASGMKSHRLTPILKQFHDDEIINLKLEEAATLCFMSPAHFSRQFKQCTGRSYTDYCQTHRLKQAGRLLTQTHHSITDISFRLGFSSPSYFIRQFKRHFGVTPKQFKQRPCC